MYPILVRPSVGTHVRRRSDASHQIREETSDETEAGLDEREHSKFENNTTSTRSKEPFTDLDFDLRAVSFSRLSKVNELRMKILNVTTARTRLNRKLNTDTGVSEYITTKPREKVTVPGNVRTSETSSNAENFNNLSKNFACFACETQDAYFILSRCLHSFCNNCKDKLAVSEGYMCVKCNEVSEKFIFNSVLCKLNVRNKTPNCAWCTEGGEMNASTGHCEQCKQWLCPECIKGHNRMPPLRSHKVTIFVDTSDTNLRCEIHPRESLELFCEACGVLTCRDCQLSVHREHGGHRWVGEKAELLKPSLAETVSSFEEKLQLLSDSSQLVSRATSKSGNLRTSVAAVKDTLKKRAAALIKAIETHTKRLEAEVDERANEYLFRLTKAESQMRVLQERIEFTLQLTKSLLENAEKDPASLVQLSTRLQARLANLADQTDWLVSDETVSNGAETDSRTLKELQKTQGWRSSALARVLHLDGHDMTDLVSQSMVVVWTREKALRSELREEKTGSLEGTLSPSRLSPRSQPTGNLSSGGESDQGCCTADEEDLGDVDRPASPAGEHDMDVDFCTNGWASGCAVCLGPGLMVFCARCHRCYHAFCHLPRLSTSKSAGEYENWMCNLCDQAFSTAPPKSDDDIKPPKRVRDLEQPKNNPPDVFSPSSTAWTKEQFDVGCRILLSLLTHPESTPFASNSVCPVCSLSLFPPNLTDESVEDDGSVATILQDCPSQWPFHQLVFLRAILEANSPNNSSPFAKHLAADVVNMDIGTWISRLDSVLAAATQPSDQPFALPDVQKAATVLRDVLDTAVERFYPTFFSS